MSSASYYAQCPRGQIIFARVPSKEVSEKHKGVRMVQPTTLAATAAAPQKNQYVPTIGLSYTGRETALLDHIMLEAHSLAYVAVHQFRQSVFCKYFHRSPGPKVIGICNKHPS